MFTPSFTFYHYLHIMFVLYIHKKLILYNHGIPKYLVSVLLRIVQKTEGLYTLSKKWGILTLQHVIATPSS